MTAPTFIQIHTLTSYPASLLNRDDVGFAKRIPFGGVPRLRVSSQCLKRHWRQHDGQHALSKIDLGAGPVGMSVRSRVTFRELVRDRLVGDGIDAALATAVTDEVMKVVLGESAKAKKSRDSEEKSEDDACKTAQITVLGRPEVDYLYGEAKTLADQLKGKKDLAKVGEAAKKHFDGERKKNLRGLQLGAGLDAGLFGRMVTSDNLARTDAAIHVAHAFTVHEEYTESDFFSAVDDLESEGSGHIGNAELTSGLFYGYVAVDLPLLVSNLSGADRAAWLRHRGPLPAEVLRRMLHLIATVSPGAKLGSTAPHAYAHFVMVERTSEQPRTLANAFLKPVAVKKGEDLMQATYVQLKRHLEAMDGMYPPEGDRRFAALGGDELAVLDPVLGEKHRMSLPELAKWVAFAAQEG